MSSKGWAIVSAFVFLIIGFWLWNFLHFSKHSDSNEIGDAMGLVNSLFSGLAFLAVVVTLIVQQKELKSQSHLASKQAFEASFFNLLSINRRIVDSLQISENTVGCSYFRIRIKPIEMPYSQELFFRIDDNKQLKDFIELIKVCTFDDLWDYQRSICAIFKFVDGYPFGSDRDAAIRTEYLEIMIAQLTVFELKWLMYFCLSDQGESMKTLVEKYSLFVELPDIFIVPSIVKSHFSPSAFLRN